MSNAIMNRQALDEILANSEEWLNSLTHYSNDEHWVEGFTALAQVVEQVGKPIADACEGDYGDAEGPVMNQAALTTIWAVCEGVYDDNRNTGNHNADWLLGVAAGIQRFEMYAGEIVADCT